MAHENMKKWLSMLDNVSTSAPTTPKSRMLTEDVVDEEDMEEGNEFSGALDAAKKQHKKSFKVGDKTYPVKEDVVDEEDMEEGNEFSGALANAKKQHKKSFEVDGKTYPVKEAEEVCPVCEAMPCECDSSKEEMISEEWSVIYDSAYAKNVPARVRLKSGMDESAVREWFNKAFQPLNIHEVFKKDKMDPKLNRPAAIVEPPKGPKSREEMGLPPKPGTRPNPKPPGMRTIEENPMAPQQTQQPQQTGGLMKQGAAAIGQVVGAYNQAKQQQQMTQMGIQPGQQYKPGPIKVDSKKKVVITPAGTKPFTQMVTSSVDREKRTDVEADDYAKMLEDIHTRLEGNYDLDAQKIAIQAVADMHKMSYEKLLAHWFEDPEGLKMQMKADDELASEQPPEEIPAPDANMAPAAGPAPGAPPAQGGVPTISEGHRITLDVEDDHEVRMAQSSLYQVAKDAAALHAMLDHADELEGWVQAKITLAADYIERVRDYIEYETIRSSEIPDEEHHHEDEIFEDRQIKKKKK
jgi:hypothetical protein